MKKYGIKKLLEIVVDLLIKDKAGVRTKRDKTRVITYPIPRNTAVQIYDYKEQRSRVVFGPELVMLGPNEQFTIQSLSGDIPKRPNVIQSICLELGPDYMTDVVIVETSDHARLSLKLSYNWYFDLDRANSFDQIANIFSVPDFVGYSCQILAGRVRNIVTTCPFEIFHPNSAVIIQEGIFGIRDTAVKKNFSFSMNHLVVTNVDIQSIEPVGSSGLHTALLNSVQLVFEITTKSFEAAARHEAELNEQRSKTLLKRQKIIDECETEKTRKNLLTFKAISTLYETEGRLLAEAKAKLYANEVNSKSELRVEELNAEADWNKYAVEVEVNHMKHMLALHHKIALDALEIKKCEELAEIEKTKITTIVETLGRDTLLAFAQTGPEMQERLLTGLGLNTSITPTSSF